MMKKVIGKNILSSYMCIAIFVVLLTFFAIATGGRILHENALKAIINQSLTTIIGGLGLIFVLAIGGIDISIGSLIGLAASLAFIANSSLGFWAMFPVAILVGVMNGLLIGFLNTKLKITSFMASISLLVALRGGVYWVLGSDYYLSPKALRGLNDWGIMIPIVLALIGITWYVFEFTPFGYYCKGIGENENAVKYAGVNTMRIKRIAFVICGLMAGVAAMFTAARVGGSDNTLGTGFEMRCLLAMYIGGIPVKGGAGTKLYKFLIGALMINMLDSGLTLMNLMGPYVQLIRGLIMMSVLAVSMFYINGSENRGRKLGKVDQDFSEVVDTE